MLFNNLRFFDWHLIQYKIDIFFLFKGVNYVNQDNKTKYVVFANASIG
ncbi:hypothetical protein [uncultured Gammaproteobacteria bacterium]|jgi:hypothetical protein|uniref:Uncharacterized protein n=3 Tax=sulfur-oxidizing symbionts TaxID=32036 RepID=A0ACA8ZS40_9GAMM|nr:hypothetical protein AZO1586R_1779 [Bathymodiolus azoricus thioautotrophic gill symbiont]CAB5507909.1 hypothetical protein AZO1586I_2184 [Bathymodiolus thermophilus thioautotrophic gill symbiont]CAC5825865.1 hypothetical protein [uncultured Gammaproteobacteria bacterium]CAC9493619.1 hypothetical protein [uncultured Gammaproteobacteria bacterium]CAC9499734.1 hypothetical protein [uncultured Gammaproteobacteria bacterium]